MNISKLAPFLAVAIIMSGCASFQKVIKSPAQAEADANRDLHTAFRARPDWRKDTFRNEALIAEAKPENSAVEISLKEQRGFLVVRGHIAMDFPVATGRSSFPTPKGNYKILSKELDHASNLYGRIVSESGETLVSDANIRTDAVPEGASFVGAKMPYWMRITPDGVGMHVGYVPGHPASHGCIRLRRITAQTLFKLLPVGTPVTVETFAPSVVLPQQAAQSAKTTSTKKPPTTT